MYNHKISVIIPSVPGRETILSRAVASVDNQRYLNIEKIIVKDKSLSATEARNKGIRVATGDLIAFLDDDDEWHKDKIYTQVMVMDKYPDCSLVTCYSKDNRYNTINKPPEIVDQRQILNAFNYSSTSTYLCRAYPLKLLNGFDESLQSAQEYELAIRLLKFHNARCVPKVLVTQNKVKGQISTNWKKKRQGIKQVYNKHKKEFYDASKNNIIKYRSIYMGYLFAPLLGKKINNFIKYMKERYEE
jgi:glycosyltransferase involved in cell wall biosynthesis